MCVTVVVHLTFCETRRPVATNLDTGTIVFHPLEPPRPCVHKSMGGSHHCPYHGPCCTAGTFNICLSCVVGAGDCLGEFQVYHLVVAPNNSDMIRSMDVIVDWEEMRKLRQGPRGVAQNLRMDFFNTGAELLEMCRLSEDLSDNFWDTGDAEDEFTLVWDHGELYRQWVRKWHEMRKITLAWEALAALGSMEPCPARHLDDVHPWKQVYQMYNSKCRGFRMIDGYPLRWRINLETKQDLIRRHPYYGSGFQVFSPGACPRISAPPNASSERRLEMVDLTPKIRTKGLRGIEPGVPTTASQTFRNILNNHGYASLDSHDGEHGVEFGEIQWNEPTTKVKSLPVSPMAGPITHMVTDVTNEEDILICVPLPDDWKNLSQNHFGTSASVPSNIMRSIDESYYELDDSYDESWDYCAETTSHDGLLEKNNDQDDQLAEMDEPGKTRRIADWLAKQACADSPTLEQPSPDQTRKRKLSEDEYVCEMKKKRATI